MDDLNQMRSLVKQAKREEHRASNDMFNHEHHANHAQSQLETCLNYKEECLNGLQTAKDSGLSIVQIRECRLLVQYLDSVVETREDKVDISLENYENARLVWQKKQDYLKRLKQALQQLEEENNDQDREQDQMINDNRLTHSKTYRVYDQKK